ncbi:MAG: HPP family protein [Saprospiraceae bacterium]
MLRSTLIRTITTAPAVTATPSSTLAQVAKLMESYNIHHVPIVDQNGHPLGIISQVDLHQISNWRSHFGHLADSAEKENKQLFDSLLAEEIMSSPVITIHEDAAVKEAADLVERYRVHCLPVVDSTGKAIGILTPHDLLRLAYNS